MNLPCGCGPGPSGICVGCFVGLANSRRQKPEVAFISCCPFYSLDEHDPQRHRREWDEILRRADQEVQPGIETSSEASINWRFASNEAFDEMVSENCVGTWKDDGSPYQEIWKRADDTDDRKLRPVKIDYKRKLHSKPRERINYMLTKCGLIHRAEHLDVGSYFYACDPTITNRSGNYQPTTFGYDQPPPKGYVRVRCAPMSQMGPIMRLYYHDGGSCRFVVAEVPNMSLSKNNTCWVNIAASFAPNWSRVFSYVRINKEDFYPKDQFCHVEIHDRRPSKWEH